MPQRRVMTWARRARGPVAYGGERCPRRMGKQGTDKNGQRRGAEHR